MVSLLGLVVVGIVVVAAVWIAKAIGRSDHPSAADADGAGVRRFFEYLLLFGLTMVLAAGISGLLGRALGAGGELVRSDDAQLARSLAFVVVGTPVFGLLAWWLRRRMDADPAEVRSLGWAFYITVTPLVALVVAMVGLHGVLLWVVGVDRFGGRGGTAGDFARLVVWGGVWAGCWWANRRIPPVDGNRLHQLAGSLVGLVTTAAGLAWLLTLAVEVVYEALGGPAVVAGTRPLREAAVVAVVGGVVWTWYWIRHAMSSQRTPLWHAYVLLVGVAGGLTTAIAAGSTLVYDLLVWTVGEPSAGTAARHFDSLPAALSTLVVGAAVWWYHRLVLREAAVGARRDIDRIYEYLVAGVGLLAAAGGLTTILVALVEALTGPAAVQVGSRAVNTLLAAVTLLVVGTPVWWVFWTRIGRAAASDPSGETGSSIRRIYLFLLFGIGGLVAVASLLVAVYLAFEDLFEGRFGSETLRDVRVPLGLVLTTGAVAAYHWVVYRDDRAAAAPRVEPRQTFVLLVGVPDEAVASAVRASTGGHVWQWRRHDIEAAPWDLEQLVDALGAAEAQEVLVLGGADGFEIVPISRV